MARLIALLSIILSVEIACIVSVSGQTAVKPCPGSNCTTNVCAAQGLNCCQCQLLGSKLNEVCACCPSGYSCCSSSSTSLYPTCCPNGWTCNSLNGCTFYNVSIPSQPSCSPCDRMYLSITADDAIDELYLDGVSYGSSLLPPNTWSNVRTFEIPADTKVIAVKSSDIYRVVAGLLASVTNDYLLTSAAWKCTKQAYLNWNQTTFNDFLWPNAAFIDFNDATNIHGAMTQISSAASWIWTSNYGGSLIDTPIYCRGYFPTGNMCNVNYGHCGNLCRLEGKTCCDCEFSKIGPTKVCNCCPKNYRCCANAGGRPTCCPGNAHCGIKGECLSYTKQISAQFNCSSCPTATGTTAG